jgi:hypothetical protein
MPQLGTFGDSFAPSWAHRRHNIENLASNYTSSIAKTAKIPVKTGDLRMSDWAGYIYHFEAI